MNIEKMREEFEAEWSRKSGWSDMQLEIFRTGDDYSDQSTSSAWWGWQASRAAIEVELPEIVCFEGAYDSIKTHEFVPRMIDIDDADEIFGLCRRIEAREAIESMGLKVKTP